MDILALSDSATVGLLGAGAAFLGTVVGAAASFGATRWQQRQERRAAQVDSVRALASEYLQIAAGAPVSLSYIDDQQVFEQQQQLLRSKLWSPRARIALYPQAKPITEAMAWFIHVVAETGSPPNDEARHMLQDGLDYIAKVAAIALAEATSGPDLQQAIPAKPFEVKVMTELTRPDDVEADIAK